MWFMIHQSNSFIAKLHKSLESLFKVWNWMAAVHWWLLIVTEERSISIRELSHCQKTKYLTMTAGFQIMVIHFPATTSHLYVLRWKLSQNLGFYAFIHIYRPGQYCTIIKHCKLIKSLVIQLHYFFIS